ncbi:hypothetical protein [Pseudomonas vancouverensis]|uniref:DUF4329 domain-containing protein n=1 Tax=Pseudomonas vancouverensis TaxID=95300 RepID=A0A1H2PAI2_PSEVA|nr:hypothetical protein [Pseudomonas vancouverensis]KAB0491849.1 hypothetical protein F7R09_24910 [Pseudomonas vancouverensis]TDB61970.1 hypothetical protein EIY72_14645 [Pseudomonas vancouverensis]SDV14674.1 hypothetical protein SAMN05216558_4560 [Pseudomonas vancouverensis]
MDEQVRRPDTAGAAQLRVLDSLFLSADDAAHFGHERVGRRRNIGYFAYILERSDGRFVLTEPQVLPLGTIPHQALPPGHVLHSQFFSHPALSTLDPDKISTLGWTVEDAATSLLMFSVHECRVLLGARNPAYLSGSENSLIGFTGNGSTSEAALRTRLGNREKPGELARDLETGAAKPEALVMAMAEAGDLHVFISDGRWRPRGKISGPVAPQPWARIVPDKVAYGAVFPTADGAALDRDFKDRAQHDQEQTWFGFILKHRDREEYISTELVALSTTTKLWRRRTLFAHDSSGRDFIYPEGFMPHSYFYSRQQVKRVQPTRGETSLWLAQNFIQPRHLYEVIYDGKRRPVMEVIDEANPNIPLYIASQDGAVLKYQAKKGTDLFDNDVVGQSLDDFERNLSRGTLTPAGFVRVIAKSGELGVISTSLCWDRTGPIGPHWIPSLHLSRRKLGPVFISADDAALYARSKIPRGRTVAFGGLILIRNDGCFVATDPIPIPQENFDIKWVFPDDAATAGLFPAGCKIVARYRSRVSRAIPVVMTPIERDLYRNMLSVDVVYTAFTHSEQALNEYLFAPDGATVRYRMGLWEKLRADLGIAIGASGNPANDLDAAWVKEQIYQRLLSPIDWVKKLANAGDLRVVMGSPLWGPPGKVANVVSSPIAISKDPESVESDPAYSPLHIQAQDSARFVHDQTARSSALSFGFVLKGPGRSPAFMATLPVEALKPALEHRQIFSGALPYRYNISAVYLRGATKQPGSTEETREHFFSPLDVSQVRTLAYLPSEYLPIYFSCADGALLRLKLLTFDPIPSTDRFGQIEFKPNPFASPEQARRDWSNIQQGKLGLTDYIRKMAAAGELEVLVTSAYWSCPGKVGQDWVPHMRAISDDDLWAQKPVLPLGPIFHHPDDAVGHAQRRIAHVKAQANFYISGVLVRPDTYSYVSVEPVADHASPSDGFLRIFRTQGDPSTSARNKVPEFPVEYSLRAAFQMAAPQAGFTMDGVDYASKASVWISTLILKNKRFNIEAFYYSTRSGALLKYIPSNSAQEGEFLSQPSSGSSADLVSRLKYFGVMRVLTSASGWNQLGNLGEDWQIARLRVSTQTDKPTRDEL